MIAPSPRVRALIANEAPVYVRGLGDVLTRLGYEPHPIEVTVATAAATVEAAAPAVALVAPLPTPADALEVIATIVRETSCPAVALARTCDSGYARAAAARGAYGVSRYDPGDLLATLETARRRYADYRTLVDAFERRATIEQAKGLLMARHGIEPEKAFAMLRQHSQRTNRKLVDVARALVRSHALLGPSHGGDQAQTVAPSRA